MPDQDSDLKIHVGTTSDVKGLDAAKKGIAEVTKEAEKLSGGGKGGGGGVLGALTSGFGAVAAAVGGVTVAVAAAKRAFSEYAEAEKGVFQLDSALQRQGNLVDAVRQKYQALAGERQKATAISDDEYIRTLTRLTQFGVRPEQIEGVLQTVEDLAGVMNGDLRGATDAVTRALQGSWQAFSRMGIIIPESATQLEKWSALAKQASEIGGGQLEAAASGAAGKMQKLGNAVSDTFEAFGRLAMIAGVGDILDTVRGSLDGLAETIGGVIPKSADLETRFSRTQQTLAESTEAAERYAKALKKVGEESDKTAKTHTQELRALDALKEREEQVAKATLDREVATIQAAKKEGRLTPDQADHLIGIKQRAAKEDSLQRDQRYAATGIAILEKLAANEDDRLKAAENAVAKADADLAAQQQIRSNFERYVQPVESELADLTKRRKEWVERSKAGGGKEWLAKMISPELKEMDSRIAELSQLGAQRKAKFEAPIGPENFAELEQNAATARKNLEAVRSTSGPRKQEILQNLGQERLRFDTRGEVGGIERQTGFIEAYGSAAAGANASAQAVSSAARDTIDAFQQYSQQNVTNQRELRAVFSQEMEKLRQDLQLLKSQFRHSSRNP